MKFKVRDRVRAVDSFLDLKEGKVYTITGFRHVNMLLLKEVEFVSYGPAHFELVESANPDGEIREVAGLGSIQIPGVPVDTKLDWTLLPVEALEDVVKVLNFGNSPEKGYGRESWKKETILKQLQSITRHVAELLKDPTATDPETGLSHAAHAACRALFIVGILKGGE